jgi:hypothetical protein
VDVGQARMAQRDQWRKNVENLIRCVDRGVAKRAAFGVTVRASRLQDKE